MKHTTHKKAARKMIAANWKEHPITLAEAHTLFDATVSAAAKTSKVDVVICPPMLFVESLSERMRKGAQKSPNNFTLGAQDIFWEDEGAFTGAVGPKMLKKLGIKHPIIGHSERRKWFAETDAIVNRKVKAALAGGLAPIVCVGEPPEVRRQGMAAAKRYLKRQLSYGLKGVAAHKVIVAYEPIWAIGSGKNDDPKDAAAVAAFIKKTAPQATRVLYGGSVKSDNVRAYVQYDEVDGALVGGASLKPREFAKLILAAA